MPFKKSTRTRKSTRRQAKTPRNNRMYKPMHNKSRTSRQEVLNAYLYQQLSYEEKMQYHIQNRTGYDLTLEPNRDVWIQLEQEYLQSLTEVTEI